MSAKHILISLLTLIPAVAMALESDAPVAVTAAKALSSAPERVFDLIEPNTRLDMIDYYEAGVDRPSANEFGGQCYITQMDSCSVSFVSGNGIDYQLFVLEPQSGSPIYGVITTLATPVPDSSIRFYNHLWQELVYPRMAQPRLEQWLRKDARKKRGSVEEAIPFVLASYSYDPATRTITVTNNMAQYYMPDDTPQELALLHQTLTYRWDGKKFTLSNR